MNRPLSALLIEDNALVADALKMRISTTDPLVRVEVVYTLADGIQRLQCGGVDVVLADLNLPDAAGVEAVIAMRTRFPEVPIVVITGTGDELAAKSIHEGAQDYLTKPFEGGEWLVKRIRLSVIRHQVRQQYCPLVAKLQSVKEMVQEAKEEVHEAAGGPKTSPDEGSV